MSNNFELILHSYNDGYIAETTIEKQKSGDFTDYELILIVDR